MLTDHDKQATENREPADETNKEDPIKAFLFVYSPSIPLKERSQIRKVLCCFKSGHKKTEAQCLYSLLQRPKLRHMLKNENYEGSVQKTQ